ncbi:MAG: hypothetical protein JWO72_2135 [Caulobacteraceae bacterium]|nr:hypothetical protein [Caulobacteraceae bacterium]
MTLRELGLACVAAWGLCATAVLPANAACQLQQLAELQVTMVGSQPTVTAGVNGHDTRFLIDSGAFYSVIGPVSAQRLGLKPSALNGQMKGIGGTTDLKMATVKQFSLTKLPLKDIQFLVAPGVDGDIAGVIGENILGVGDVEYDLANGVVRLFKPQDCANANLGYWADGTAAELILEHTARPDQGRDINRHVQARAEVNGQKVTVTFDTGAGRSMLNLAAAARAGVTPQTPGTVDAGLSSGFGPRAVNTWLAPFSTFVLGSERIRNTTLRIGALGIDNTDMLLGADFFLSHRVYVANSQGRIYLTYNGGPVFRYDSANVAALAPAQTPLPSAPAPQADADPPPADINAPTDAAGFLRRGSAFVARRDYGRAIEDFTRAIALDPANAEGYMRRGAARLAHRQPALGIADLDEALKLKPDDKDALLARGSFFLAAKDLPRARADLDAAARLDAPAGQVRLEIAAFFEHAGLWQDAIRNYDGWIAANPKAPLLPGALNSRCWARAVLKTDLDKALGDCNAALKLAPRTAAFLDSRALVRVDREEWDLAIADYDAALKLKPQVAITLYARGLAKEGKGRKADGDADIAAALALDAKVADEARRFGFAAHGPAASGTP